MILILLGIVVGQFIYGLLATFAIIGALKEHVLMKDEIQRLGGNASRYS